MRAWWWVLITAHLVWGNPEGFKHDFKNTINLETNQNTVAEGRLYPNFDLSPTFYTRTRRSFEGDEREKKEMRFHSWGGKRYGSKEEDEMGDNGDMEENGIFHEPGEEDLLTEISSHLSSNASRLEADDFGERFREAFTKRRESSPAFYPWGGKRDPEMMNDVSKRSTFYSPIFAQSLFDSKPEKSRKRYPSFSSWAGKRAFNSWGGKRDYNNEKRDYNNEERDYSTARRDHSKAKIGFGDETEETVILNNDDVQVHTSPISKPLDSEDNWNVQGHDPDNSNSGEHYSRAIFEEKEHHSPENYQLQLENPILKRAAAFSSWGGKRNFERNLVMMKKPVSFNSWAGKRAPAFNSWGGKRAAAFNSRGGKRAASFNSWGGKRAAAFNSWGGKRAAAFNSWGGKRAAAFNSWGGKRAAAFNSWGGKRDFDKRNEKPEFEYPNWTRDMDLYDVHFPEINSDDNNFERKTNKLLHQTDNSNTIQEYNIKHIFKNNIGKTKEKTLKNHFYELVNDKWFTNVDPEELNNHEKSNSMSTVESLGHSDNLKKRNQPSFTSWAGKRSPLFSSWYGGKIPTLLLTNGKRRPAFSSWGGKRSEHGAGVQLDCSTGQKPEEVLSNKPPPPEEKAYARKKRDVECSGKKNPSILTIERDKRASGNFLKNRVFTRMMLQGWPVAFHSSSHGKDFFAWGGKRSSDVTTLR